MRKIRINVNLNDFPEEIRPYVERARVFDSSCSPEARVWFLDFEGGLYLKSAKRGSLRKEAVMDEYFFRKELGAPEVVKYIEGERDWLLTSRVAGEDCTHANYLENPKKLCDLLAIKLRELHETDFSDCPIMDHTGNYLAVAEKNYKNRQFDLSFFDVNSTADEAWRILKEGRAALKNEVLLHGDYCLPNIMLDNWNFSGFIDLGNGGVGDRHVDLFWGAWTLNFNLGTDEYRERFFDAYGRDKIDKDRLLIVSAAEVFG